jgi:hypothetical protein
MKKKLQTITVFLLCFYAVSAQTWDVVWQTKLQNIATIRHSFVNREGNIVVVGNWNKEQDESALFAVYNTQGKALIEPKKLLEKKFYASAVAQASDGGYWLLGRRVVPEEMNANILTLSRMNSKGEVIKNLDLGKTRDDMGQLAPSPQGTDGVIVCANIDGRLTALRIAWDGQFFEKRWNKQFDTWTELSDVAALPNGQYLVVGNKTNTSKSFLKCLNTEGALVWEKEYTDVKMFAATTDAQGQIWVTGTASQHNKNYQDVLLMSINTEGGEKTRQYIGGIGIDAGTTILYNTKGNDFFIAGYSTSHQRGDRFYDMALWHVNNQGQNIEPPFFYGEGKTDKALTACLLPNNTVFMGGESANNGLVLMLKKQNSFSSVAPAKPDMKPSQPNINSNPPNPTQPFIKIEWQTPEIELLKDNKGKTDKDVYPIKVKIMSRDSISNENIKIWLNGVEGIPGVKMDNEPIIPGSNNRSGSYIYIYPSKVPLKRDSENTIEVVVTVKGREARSEKIYITCTQKPKLYIFSVGVPGHGLEFTSQDAAAIAESFKSQNGPNALFDDVDIRLLNTDALTTYKSIKKAVGSLIDVEKVQEQDLILVFISSHGFVYPKGNSFIIEQSDYENGLATTGLEFRKDILEPLATVNCKKLYLIDACHSGGISSGAKGDQSLATALRQWDNARSGDRFIVSSAENEFSYELKSKGHGAFTQAILEAFRNEWFMIPGNPNAIHADKNDDKVLTLSELYAFLSVRVPVLIKEEQKSNQNPVKIKIEREEDDLPIYKY